MELKPYQQTFSDDYFTEMLKLLSVDELKRLLSLLQQELSKYE